MLKKYKDAPWEESKAYSEMVLKEDLLVLKKLINRKIIGYKTAYEISNILSSMWHHTVRIKKIYYE